MINMSWDNYQFSVNDYTCQLFISYNILSGIPVAESNVNYKNQYILCIKVLFSSYILVTSVYVVTSE